MRDFTEEERNDRMNKELKGVRTYFFNANHFRGLPEFNTDGEWEDHAWVPKR